MAGDGDFSFKELWDILLRHWRVFVSVSVVGILIAGAFLAANILKPSLLREKGYQASTTVAILGESPLADGPSLAGQTGSAFFRSAIEENTVDSKRAEQIATNLSASWTATRSSIVLNLTMSNKSLAQEGMDSVIKALYLIVYANSLDFARRGWLLGEAAKSGNEDATSALPDKIKVLAERLSDLKVQQTVLRANLDTDAFRDVPQPIVKSLQSHLTRLGQDSENLLSQLKSVQDSAESIRLALAFEAQRSSEILTALSSQAYSQGSAAFPDLVPDNITLTAKGFSMRDIVITAIAIFVFFILAGIITVYAIAFTRELKIVRRQTSDRR